MKVICKNIQFDVPMGKSLFSMDVPEGYKLQQMELDLQGSTEQDFIEGLRIRAEVLGDGQFPDSVAVEDYIKAGSDYRQEAGRTWAVRKRTSSPGNETWPTSAVYPLLQRRRPMALCRQGRQARRSR